VDRFNGDNNSTPEVNGEYFFLRNELLKLGAGVVFDVGANVGNWASFALDINPRVNLHCFEPSKAMCARLAQKQWPSNVWLNNLGVGEVEVDAKVNLGDIWYFLEPYGFRFYKLYPEGPRDIEKYQQSLGRVKCSNWVSIHGAHNSF
jgi:hypothetical protein